MTKTRKKQPKGNSEIISVRLPKPILDKLDAEVKKQDSSRTDIVRAGLACYFALETSVMVPLSFEYREKLLHVAKKRKVAAQILASDLLKSSLDKGDQPRIVVHIGFAPSLRYSPGQPESTKKPLKPFVWSESEISYAKV